MLHSNIRSSKPRWPAEIPANPILCLQVGQDGRSVMADEIRITQHSHPDDWYPARSDLFAKILSPPGRSCLSNVRIAGQKSGARRPLRFASLLPAAPPAVPTAPPASVESWSPVVAVSSIEVRPSPASPPRITNPADLIDVGKVPRMRQAVRHCRSCARSEHGNSCQGSQADNNRLEIHVVSSS